MTRYAALAASTISNLKGGPGNDILCGGGDGDDLLEPAWDEDVIYGGDGNDWIGGGSDGQRDKLYCGEGKDYYSADRLDYVDSSCEIRVRGASGTNA